MSRSCVRTLCAVPLLLLPLSAAAGVADPLSGEWSRSDGETRISIAPCGDKVCAVNTWVRDPAGDEKVGDRFVMTVRPLQPAAPAMATLAGQAVDVRRGLAYSVRISLQGESMTTRGCLIEGILCKAMSWVRAR